MKGRTLEVSGTSYEVLEVSPAVGGGFQVLVAGPEGALESLVISAGATAWGAKLVPASLPTEPAPPAATPWADAMRAGVQRMAPLEVDRAAFIGEPEARHAVPSSAPEPPPVTPGPRAFAPEPNGRNVRHGVFRIFWKDDGGVSIATVGSGRGGARWFAPLNWLDPPSTMWERVDRLEMLLDEKGRPAVDPAGLTPARDLREKLRARIESHGVKLADASTEALIAGVDVLAAEREGARAALGRAKAGASPASLAAALGWDTAHEYELSDMLRAVQALTEIRDDFNKLTAEHGAVQRRADADRKRIAAAVGLTAFSFTASDLVDAATAMRTELETARAFRADLRRDVLAALGRTSSTVPDDREIAALVAESVRQLSELRRGLWEALGREITAPGDAEIVSDVAVLVSDLNRAAGLAQDAAERLTGTKPTRGAVENLQHIASALSRVTATLPNPDGEPLVDRWIGWIEKLGEDGRLTEGLEALGCAVTDATDRVRALTAKAFRQGADLGALRGLLGEGDMVARVRGILDENAAMGRQVAEMGEEMARAAGGAERAIDISQLVKDRAAAEGLAADLAKERDAAVAAAAARVADLEKANRDYATLSEQLTATLARQQSLDEDARAAAEVAAEVAKDAADFQVQLQDALRADSSDDLIGKAFAARAQNERRGLCLAEIACRLGVDPILHYALVTELDALLARAGRARRKHVDAHAPPPVDPEADRIAEEYMARTAGPVAKRPLRAMHHAMRCATADVEDDWTPRSCTVCGAVTEPIPDGVRCTAPECGAKWIVRNEGPEEGDGGDDDSWDEGYEVGYQSARADCAIALGLALDLQGGDWNAAIAEVGKLAAEREKAGRAPLEPEEASADAQMADALDAEARQRDIEAARVLAQAGESWRRGREHRIIARESLYEEALRPLVPASVLEDAVDAVMMVVASCGDEPPGELTDARGALYTALRSSRSSLDSLRACIREHAPEVDHGARYYERRIEALAERTPSMRPAAQRPREAIAHMEADVGLARLEAVEADVRQLRKIVLAHGSALVGLTGGGG